MSELKLRFWRSPIFGGVVLTLALAILVYLLGIQVGPNGEMRYIEFLGSPPNAIGDTLAGIFAPLAFIWIVVTVFLQSHELREQRKELGLTREELRLAREAQQQQLGVMQKQADIFEDEKKRRDEDVQRRYLDMLVKSFSASVRYSTCVGILWRPVERLPDGSETFLDHWTFIPETKFDGNIEDHFLIASRRIIESSSRLAETMQGRNCHIFASGVDASPDVNIRNVFVEELKRLTLLTKKMIDARNNLGSVEQGLLEHWRIDKLIKALDVTDFYMSWELR